MKINDKVNKVLMVGPYPPPYHGTSIPFAIFCDSLTDANNYPVQTRVFDTQSGDKAMVSMWNLKVLLLNVILLIKLPAAILWSNKVVVFGSQRFCTTFGVIVASFARLLRIPVYVRINGGGYDQYIENRSSLAKHAIIQIMNLYIKLIFETELVREKMAMLWPSKTYCVPNFRLSRSASIPRGKQCHDSVKFIYTGIVRKAKGCEEMLEAFAMAKKTVALSHPHMRMSLDIYGPIYSLGQDVVSLSIASGDPDIYLHGNVNADVLWQALSRADVFLFPSYWPTEGHSGAIIEAMMIGLPVIAARWRSTPEVVADGFNGLLCEPRDVHSLAAQMVRISLDPQLKVRLGNGARQSSCKYDATVICRQLRELFEI